MSSPVSSIPVVPVDLSRPQLSRTMSSMPPPSESIMNTPPTIVRTMPPPLMRTMSLMPSPMDPSWPWPFPPEDSSKKDARIAELEAELAKKDAQIAEMDSLKGAWDQLMSIYKEMDDKWEKVLADYGNDRKAIDASGILDAPEMARFNYEEEWDCIHLVYDRIPVAFRGL